MIVKISVFYPARLARVMPLSAACLTAAERSFMNSIWPRTPSRLMVCLLPTLNESGYPGFDATNGFGAVGRDPDDDSDRPQRVISNSNPLRKRGVRNSMQRTRISFCYGLLIHLGAGDAMAASHAISKAHAVAGA